MMYSIATIGQLPLKWTQPNMLKMEYELRTGEVLVGGLTFRSSFGTFATAESGDGCWTFKRIGFWQNRASVRKSGSEEDLAIFYNNTWSGGGTLKMADGKEYRLTTNFWNTRMDFINQKDEILVRFHVHMGFKISAEVEVLPAALTLPELPLLVLLGWYLTVMLYNDSAAGAAAISAGAAS